MEYSTVKLLGRTLCAAGTSIAVADLYKWQLGYPAVAGIALAMAGGLMNDRPHAAREVIDLVFTSRRSGV
jgi:hypothetical protein